QYRQLTPNPSSPRQISLARAAIGAKLASYLSVPQTISLAYSRAMRLPSLDYFAPAMAHRSRHANQAPPPRGWQSPRPRRERHLVYAVVEVAAFAALDASARRSAMCSSFNCA